LTVGLILGLFGAAVSLLANMIAAPMFGQPAMQLIRVYLTFPMGEKALLETSDAGLVLTVGSILYIVTGGLYGIVFHLITSTFFADASPVKSLIVHAVLGLALWVINFYLILSWLQPALLGDNWIISEIPIVVAALTHLVFALTIWLLELFRPAQRMGQAA